MHPRIRELLDRLDRQHVELLQAVDAVPVALRSRRPTPDRWSVAEIVDHVAIVEEQILELFTRLVADASAKGLGPERDSGPIASSADLERVQDRTRRLTARAAIQPRAGIEWAAAWERLERAREAMRGAVRGADGLALGEVSAPNPVLGPLNLYEWILFVAGHQARHTAQIREVGAALGAS
jgi:uncharacterized damage-inducible protein DinB